MTLIRGRLGAFTLGAWVFVCLGLSGCEAGAALPWGLTFVFAASTAALVLVLQRALGAHRRAIHSLRSASGAERHQSQQAVKHAEAGAFRDRAAQLRSEALMRSVFDAVDLALVIVDGENRVQACNDAGARLFERAVGEMLGADARALSKAFAARLHDPRAHLTLTRHIVQSDAPSHHTLRMVDGTVYEQDTFPLTTPDAAGRIWATRDVTSRVLLEAQFREAQKAEAIGKLAGGVAHDFNNLLQAIVGFTHLALDEIQDLPAADDLREVLDATDQATTLVRQLLTFSRRDPVQPRHLHLNELLENMSRMLRRVVGEQVVLGFHLKELGGTLHADPGQLEQLVMNLALNARDAMPDGGQLTIETSREVLDHDFCAAHRWAKPGAYVCLSLSDDGTGMTEEVQALIFEPFFTTKPQGEGSGLGLAAVDAIVRRHDGFVRVVSDEGVGTCFRIYLPLDAQLDASTQGLQSAPRSNPAGVDPGLIIFAEDEAQVRTCAARVLERAGFTVLCAEDGREAIQAFDAHADRVQLMVIDSIMPKLNGREVFEHVRTVNPKVPVLFSSGYSLRAKGTGPQPAIGVHQIQKPYHPEALLAKVYEMLR